MTSFGNGLSSSLAHSLILFMTDLGIGRTVNLSRVITFFVAKLQNFTDPVRLPVGYNEIAPVVLGSIPFVTFLSS